MPFTEFTCRSGGSNLYAGTLDGSAEASTTPLVTYTNGNWNSATGIFTPASGNPVSAGVTTTHWVSIYNDGDGAPTGFIAAVTAVSSTTITVSLTRKSGTAPTTSATARTLVVGGAWAGPGGASQFPLAFMQSTATNASGDPVRVNLKSDITTNLTATATTTNAGPLYFSGYTTTFGDTGRFTLGYINSGGSNYLALSINVGCTQVQWNNIIFSGNGSNATGDPQAMSCASNTVLFINCVFKSFRTSPNFTGTGIGFKGCEFFSNLVAGATVSGSACFVDRCIFHDNPGASVDGLVFGGGTQQSVTNSIFDTNGRYGLSVTATTTLFTVKNCVAYNNTSDGIRSAISAGTFACENNLLVSNGGFGINRASGSVSQYMANNAYFSNTSGQTNGFVGPSEIGAVTLTGIPFTDGPNGDFRLNNTSGAGDACRGAGIGSFTQTAASYAGTVGYPDIGAAQHQDAGGGGSVAFSTTGRRIG